MNNIVNLTQHNATEAQLQDGVYEIECADTRAFVKRLLTFDTPPTKGDIAARAAMLAAIASQQGATAAMIGGAPYLMGVLEASLKEEGITPLYSFTRRETIEENRDGVVTKTSVFRHVGWVEV